MKPAAAYYRVSTARQGRSGLGLDAQQAAILRHITTNGYTLIREFQEIKSTRKHRAGLQAALQYCQSNNAALIVASLDRLGRDVEEIARIVKSSVEIVVADNPYANRFTIHILAAVAEEQRRTISQNTKEALRAAKRKGKQLGKNGKKLGQKNKEAAARFAITMKPVILDLRKQGIVSTRTMAAELNRQSVPTFSADGKWHRTTVHSLLRRLK